MRPSGQVASPLAFRFQSTLAHLGVGGRWGGGRFLVFSCGEDGFFGFSGIGVPQGLLFFIIEMAKKRSAISEKTCRRPFDQRKNVTSALRSAQLRSTKPTSFEPRSIQYHQEFILNVVPPMDGARGSQKPFLPKTQEI